MSDKKTERKTRSKQYRGQPASAFHHNSRKAGQGSGERRRFHKEEAGEMRFLIQHSTFADGPIYTGMSAGSTPSTFAKEIAESLALASSKLVALIRNDQSFSSYR